MNSKMNIPNILQSISAKLESGAMTMWDAQLELCEAGWFPYIPDANQVTNLLSKSNGK